MAAPVSLDFGSESGTSSHEPAPAADSSVAVVVVGASGDLAKKKTYPALFKLYLGGLLPANIKIWGYARSANTSEDLREKLRSYLEPFAADRSHDLDVFLSMLVYFQGQYNSPEDFAKLSIEMTAWQSTQGEVDNRIFYLAIPPSVFAAASRSVKNSAMSATGWSRVVIEKPFGHDLESFNVLEGELSQLLEEHQMFRIDHYLGKEMVQNLMTLRFSNAIFEPIWNRHHVSSVSITFKEDITVEGRAGYFNDIGLIRDVMQNHLLQLVTLVAMEPPCSLSAEDVRDEKVKVLRSMKVLELDDVILGQYEGYTFDPEVPNDSTTETFALATMWIDNARWKGVPFIVKCGKALDDRKAEIRIQFAESPLPFYENANRNELVIRVQPDEAMYLKTNVKKVGEQGIVTAELDLTYKHRFSEAYIPDAYERLILDVFEGEHANFVRNDELKESWGLFTPLLHELGSQRPAPFIYKQGSRGPKEADGMIEELGVQRTEDYKWQDRKPDSPKKK